MLTENLWEWKNILPYKNMAPLHNYSLRGLNGHWACLGGVVRYKSKIQWQKFTKKCMIPEKTRCYNLPPLQLTPLSPTPTPTWMEFFFFTRCGLIIVTSRSVFCLFYFGMLHPCAKIYTHGVLKTKMRLVLMIMILNG